MLYSKIGLLNEYDLDSPKFKTAFSFLQNTNLEKLQEGWIQLDNNVRVSVQRYTSFKWDDNKFETHKNFLDLQYVISGEELCAVCHKEDLGPIYTPYDEQKDIAFYEDPRDYSSIILKARDLVILTPDDPHKPRCSIGFPLEIRKIVIKIPV